MNFDPLTSISRVQSANSAPDLSFLRHAIVSSVVLLRQPQISANLVKDSSGLGSMAQYSKADPLWAITAEKSSEK